LPLAEAYVRGSDLVASFRPTSDWPYSPQIYWHAGHLDFVPGVVGSLTLLVSVQTHLLDTYPQITVGSMSQAENVIRMGVHGGKCEESTEFSGEFTNQAPTAVCCILRRFTGITLSYAEFIPGSDYRAVRAWTGDGGDCGVQWQLFSEFLEKGVIRRARVHGAFLRRDGDVEAAAACCEAIECEALPLTT
jgi:hypothetical protein